MDFLLRAPDAADLTGLVALARAGAAESGIPSALTAEDIAVSWRRPHFDRVRHHRVAEVDGRIVGAASLAREGATVEGGGSVLPEFRGRGIGGALLRWLVETARGDLGAREVFTWADSQRQDANDLIASVAGAEHVRSFYRMINRAPASTPQPEWPPGIRLEALEGDALVAAAVEAHDNSFVDHWNFTPVPPEEFAHWLGSPREEPALWFIAVAADGRIAGFNLCHLELGGSVTRGLIGPLGTTRPFRGIGLGRALLRHGVHALAARGATEVVLGVDTQNENGAVGLYERNGFEVLRRGNVYRIKLS